MCIFFAGFWTISWGDRLVLSSRGPYCKWSLSRFPLHDICLYSQTVAGGHTSWRVIDVRLKVPRQVCTSISILTYIHDEFSVCIILYLFLKHVHDRVGKRLIMSICWGYSLRARTQNTLKVTFMKLYTEEMAIFWHERAIQGFFGGKAEKGLTLYEVGKSGWLARCMEELITCGHTWARIILQGRDGLQSDAWQKLCLPIGPGNYF